MALAVRSNPLGRADHAVTDRSELHVAHEFEPIAFLQRDTQRAAGAVRPVADGNVLPPEKPTTNAAPFVLVRYQRHERLGITPIQRVGRGAKLIEHASSMPTKAPTRIELVYEALQASA